MKFKTSTLVATSLLFSTACATVPVEVSAPITPREAFPGLEDVDIEKRGVISDLVDSIIDKIENAVTCAGCEALTTVLKGVAYLGDGVFVTVLTGICKALKVQDADVCEGIVGTEGPVIAKILRDITIASRTNKVLCTSLFGLCEAPAILPYTGTIPVPASNPQVPPAPASTTKPLKFVHISDTHIDRLYKNGTNWKCTKPICCRPYTANDDVGQTQNPTGPFGHVGCDTPVTLEQSLYEAVKANAGDADFVIFTGDIIDAALWLQSQTNTVAGMKDMYSRMSSSGFGKVYGVIGNHDSAPVNLFPIIEPETKYGSAVPFYNEMSADLEKWVGTTAANSIKQNSGCYSVVHPGTNLKIISINTNFWYSLNLWVYEKNGLDTQKDPRNVFAWLTAELQAAESAGQSAFVIGHMPPGITDALRDYSNYFNKIVTRYSSTIKGMFWGHTHSDEFEVTYKDPKARSYSNALITSYVTSCVTPRSANPVFRVYSVDPTTYQILDYDQYYTSIEGIGYGSTAKPEWKKLYSAKQDLGSLVSPPIGNAPLTAAFWHNLTVAFEENEGAFQTWFDRKIANFNTTENCDGDCKKNEICQMRASATELSCYKPSFGGLVGRAINGPHSDLVKRGASFNRVHNYLHRGPRTQHGTLQCGGQMLEILMKLARDKDSITRVVKTSVTGKV